MRDWCKSRHGIGYEIARGLATADRDGVVILACRNPEQGRRAQQKLCSEGLSNVEFLQLDLGSEDSICAFVESVSSKYSKLDVLCNNGAIAFKNSDPTPFEQQAAPTFAINYFGTASLTMKLLPLLRLAPEPRIVNIASMAGHLRILKSKPELVKQLKEGVTIPDLEELVIAPFIQAVQQGVHGKHGWPATCYGMSKLCVIAFTKALARVETGIAVNACCPGWCATDMSSMSGPKTAAQGAATPLLLLTEPSLKVPRTGEFWQDERPIEW